MEHRVFKSIKEKIEKGENIFFIYGNYNFVNDLFYTKTDSGGKLLPLRESFIEVFKQANIVENVLEIYYEDGKIKSKSSKVFKRYTKIKDELGDFEDITKEESEKEYQDNVALINDIKHFNLNTLKKGKWLIIFDDFNQIGKIYRGFEADEIRRLFFEVILNWRKISNNYYLFLIRDKELGWLEEFGINKEIAVEVFEPSVHEIALTLHLIAKEKDKILHSPLSFASKYVENPKPLKVIKEEFEEIVKQTKTDYIDLKTQDDDIGLDDVKLLPSVKERIRDIFDKFRDGKSVTNGLIFYGPPGTGKTTIAKALANEAGSYFLKTSASDFKGEYLGQSAQNTRRIFEKLKANKPAILFIDEADAILAKRSGESRNVDTYTMEIVNEFLANVDGLKADKEIFVIIATNYLNRLDDAILSRFEKIEIGLPEGDILKDLVKEYLGNDFEKDYELFKGLSGRDISQLGKQLKEGVIKSKDEIIKKLTSKRLVGLDEIQPKINFSDVYGYQGQKEYVKRLFGRGIRRLVVCGDIKVGKTFFIEAIAGEFGYTIIKKLPDSRERLYGIEDKVIFYSKNSIPNELIDNFSDIPALIELDLKEESVLDILLRFGFLDVKLEIDEDTVIDFVSKKFGENINYEQALDLAGKSFPYIENKIKFSRR